MPAAEGEATQVPVSDFLTAHAPEKKSARLSSALLDYKRPDGLNLVPLGAAWAQDVFVRPHNGIRRELIDLYNMIDSMQRRVQNLRSTDLDMFFDWWDVFASYLEAVFRASDTLLIPWALKGAAAPGALAPDVQAAAREHIKTMTGLFDVIIDQARRRPPDESLAKIIKAITHLHPIFDYVQAVESVMPEIADGNYSNKEGIGMDKKLADFVAKNGPDDIRKYHIHILARGMTTEVSSAWRRRLPLGLRVSSKLQKSAFRGEHLHAVDRLALVD